MKLKLIIAICVLGLNAITKSLYFDVGPVASISFGGEVPWEQPYHVGIET